MTQGTGCTRKKDKEKKKKAAMFVFPVQHGGQVCAVLNNLFTHLKGGVRFCSATSLHVCYHWPGLLFLHHPVNGVIVESGAAEP